jgi:DNA mismatch repair protein MutS2
MGKGQQCPMTVIQVGTSVSVKKLRKSGVVTALLSGGRLRVVIGALTITCRREEVSVIPMVATNASTHRANIPTRIRKAPGATPPSSLDLHGLTVADAIRKLESWLDRVILADLSQVKVIHGLGSGKVQRAVHTSLAAISAVRHFQLNAVNPGETDIYL